MKMSTQGIVYLVYFIILCQNNIHAIYDPSNHLASRYNNPVETGNSAQQHDVIMYHNYSKVTHQTTVTNTYPHPSGLVSPPTTTPVPLARKPRNFYHEAEPLQIKRERQQQLLSSHTDQCPQGYTGQIALSDSCHMFMNCHKGRGIAQSCAPGTLFNSETLECDHAHKVTCFSEALQRRQRGLRMTAHKMDMRNLSPRQECPEGFTGIMPNYGDCSKYIICQDKLKQLVMDCAPGTLFDVKSNLCRFPRDAKCFQGGDLQQSETQQQPIQRQRGGQNQQRQVYQQNQQGNLECPPGNIGRLLPHPVHCDQYLQCDDGRTHVRPCGPGTVFNPSLSVCDWPSNVKNCGQSLDGDNNRDSRFHNGYVNQYNGENSSSVGFNRTSVETSPFDSNYHENFGANNNDNIDYQNGGHNPNHQYFLTTTPIPIEDDEGGYGYYQVRPTRMTPQKPTRGSMTQQWPPPFPEAVNTDYDYVIDYEQLPETTDSTRKGIVTTTSRPLHQNCQQMFECQRNECIAINLVCDTKRDCKNGKDEYNCADSILQFAQTPQAKLAIKEYNKYRNVSVTYCARLCHETTDFICKSFNYRQIDASCFLLNSNVAETGLLIQMPTYTYYEHTLHSVDCTDLYRCKNNKCINRAKVCDGIDDCLDRQDEQNCAPEVFGYELTLETPNGGYQTNEGHLVVTAFGRRGYICDDGFTINSAHVACKELGYALGALQVHPASYYPPIMTSNIQRYNNNNGSNTFYIMDDVVCTGEETHLKDCYFTGWGVNDCKDGEVVGVVCKMNELATMSVKPTIIDDQTNYEYYLCASNEWLCQSKTECLPLQYLCDGIYDCADSSDEWERLCSSTLEVRLVGKQTSTGSNNKEGRLEVRYHGTWGTVCDDGFKDRDATVVCRQLLKGVQAQLVVGQVIRNGLYGPGIGPIWLDQVTCAGNETNLTDCGHSQWNKHNCEHSEDVAIKCTLYQHHQQQNTPSAIKGGRNQQQYAFRHNKEDLELYKYPGKCGMRADDLLRSGATFRVLNAPAAPPGSYPWQATISLRSHNVSSSVHWCGGVIISPLYVLTAAHCLDGVKKSSIRINAGDYDRDIDEGTEQIARVEDFVQHEEFRHGSRKNNDIAVIKLTEPGFRMTEDVKAICLPDVDVEYRGGTTCAVSGFGVTEQSVKKASRQLRAGWIPIQTKAVCKMAHIYGNEMMEGMFCAGSLEGGVDACDGDSGGPLACLHEGYYTLFGITSWGHKCGEANNPGVYVKVAYYRQWIQDAVDKLNTD